MKKGFFHQTFILTTAGILVRIIGAIYRIILPRLMGAEGVGLYQMAYPVYSLLLVFAIPGFPLAISKQVAEGDIHKERGEVGKIMLGGLLVLFFSGLLLTAFLILLSPFIATRILGDDRSFYPLFFLAPSLLFFFLMSAFRGFFQGLENMFPTALSLVVEQLARLFTILLVVYLLRDAPIEKLAGGAALGNLGGALAGLTVLLLLFLRAPVSILFPPKEFWGVFFQGLRIYPLAIPISMGALIMPLMGLVDAVIVPNRLQVAGWTMEEATSLFGQLSGMAMTVFFFPTVISGAVALSILPFVSQKKMKGEFPLIQQRTGEAFRLVFLVMLPATAGIMVLSRPVCDLLFGYPTAGIPLFYLALGLTFYALQDISASILQGLDQIRIPAINLLVGALFNAAVNYSLTPRLGIVGAAVGTITGIFIGGGLNLRALHQELGINIQVVQYVGKPLTAALGMGLLLFYLHPFLSHVIPWEAATLLSIGIGMMIYFSLILMNGGIRIQELGLLPIIGPRIKGWFHFK